MMLGFFSRVNAVYIYHRYSQLFLGIERRSVTSNDMIVPVKDAANAISFRFSEGGKNVNMSYNPKSLSEITEDPSTTNVRISHPTINKSWDFEGGVRDGAKLIAYSSHNMSNQMFEIKTLSDLSVVLVSGGKCLQYNESFQGFTAQPCTNLSKSKFDLFIEAVPTKKEEPVQPMLTPKDPEFASGDLINYQNGQVVNFNKDGIPIDAETPKLVFKDGKAIRTGHLDDLDGIRFNHQILNLNKATAPVRAIENDDKTEHGKESTTSEKIKTDSEDTETDDNNDENDEDCPNCETHLKKISLRKRKPHDKHSLKMRKYI